MTIDSGAKQEIEAVDHVRPELPTFPTGSRRPTSTSYRGPHDGETGRRGHRAPRSTRPSRRPGDAGHAERALPAWPVPPGRRKLRRVYPADDPAGFGPALQVVTDHGGMLMDSVTVLLHRLGVGYTAIMTPVFEVHRSPTGDLLSVEPKAPQAARRSTARPGYTSSSCLRSTARPSPRSNGCCPRC